MFDHFTTLCMKGLKSKKVEQVMRAELRCRMRKIIFIIQKPKSKLIDFEHRKLLGACLITISPLLDCISNERIEKLHIALLGHLPPMRTSH